MPVPASLIVPNEPAEVVQVGEVSTLINPTADIPETPVAEANLIFYGSCSFKKLALGATAVTCVALLNVVVEASKSVPEFPTNVIVPPLVKFVPVITIV